MYKLKYSQIVLDLPELFQSCQILAIKLATTDTAINNFSINLYNLCTELDPRCCIYMYMD